MIDFSDIVQSIFGGGNVFVNDFLLGAVVEVARF